MWHKSTGRRGEIRKERLIGGDLHIDLATRLGAVERVERKDHIDLFGAVALIAFALHLAFNQVVVAVTNGGFQPVFQAGLRSAGAIVVLALWMRLRGVSFHVPRRAMLGGVLSGVFFALEFMGLFNALDLTTVSRASVIFYSMPVWLAVIAHFFFPGEGLTRTKSIGLVLAMAGVAIALADRGGGTVSWTGDLLALSSAFCWAAIVVCVRLTPLSEVPPAQQLMFQVMVSAPILLLLSPLFGPFLRDVQPIHVAGLLFQIVAIASLGFLAWFWLISIYPASSVASFSFLSPVFSVLLGWLLLSEDVALSVWGALVLVASGIYLINRKPRVAG